GGRTRPRRRGRSGPAGAERAGWRWSRGRTRSAWPGPPSEEVEPAVLSGPCPRQARAFLLRRLGPAKKPRPGVRLRRKRLTDLVKGAVARPGEAPGPAGAALCPPNVAAGRKATLFPRPAKGNSTCFSF